MASFPLTFPHAGLNFTVTCGGRGIASLPADGGRTMVENVMYIRVSDRPRVEEFGLVQRGETNDALARRIGKWWDEKHPATPAYTIEPPPPPAPYTIEQPPLPGRFTTEPPPAPVDDLPEPPGSSA